MLFHLFRRYKDNTPEWAIIELQGDLGVRSCQNMDGQFIGDLCYSKYGQPVNINFFFDERTLILIFLDSYNWSSYFTRKRTENG